MKAFQSRISNSSLTKLAVGKAGLPPLMVFTQSKIGSWSSLRPPLIAGSIAGVRLVSFWFNFLIANVQYRALAVLVDYFKPAARFGIVEEIVMRVIGKYVARAETIANQGTWILFFPERDALVELGERGILIVEIGWIES